MRSFSTHGTVRKSCMELRCIIDNSKLVYMKVLQALKFAYECDESTLNQNGCTFVCIYPRHSNKKCIPYTCSLCWCLEIVYYVCFVYVDFVIAMPTTLDRCRISKIIIKESLQTSICYIVYGSPQHVCICMLLSHIVNLENENYVIMMLVEMMFARTVQHIDAEAKNTSVEKA